MTGRLGTILATICILSALTATTASAVLTFETVKWLANGVAVAAELATEVSGGLVFRGEEAGEEFLCEALLAGTVNTGGAGTITKVLDIVGTEIASLDESGATSGLVCTNLKVCESVEIWPVNLPFHTVLDLDSETGKLTDLLVNAEYFLLCEVLKIDATELCVVAPNSLSGGEVVNLGTDVEGVGSVEPLSTCNGKEETGLITPDAGNLTFLTNGETLAAS
jgi:hypothetical protein